MDSDIIDSKGCMFSTKEDPFISLKQEMSKILCDHPLDSPTNANELDFIGMNKLPHKLMLNDNGESQTFSEMDNPFIKIIHKEDQSPPPRPALQNSYSPLTYFPSNMNLSSQYNHHTFNHNTKSNHSQESFGLTPQRSFNKYSDDYYNFYEYDHSNPQPFRDLGVPPEFSEHFNDNPMNLVWSGHDSSRPPKQKFTVPTDFSHNKLSFSNEFGAPVTYVNDPGMNTAGFGYDAYQDNQVKAQQGPEKILVTKIEPHSLVHSHANFSVSKDFNEVRTPNKSKQSADFKTTCKSTPLSKASKGREDDIDLGDDEDDEYLDAKHRSSRGLRVLSVKVKDIVAEKKKTTYKEVADDLIYEFLEKFNKKRGESKDEQNVKRRVYDALNVLIAADILKKNGKTVFCDETLANLGPPKQKKLRAEKETLETKIYETKKRNKHKTELMQELIFKCLAIKNLTTRNKENIQIIDQSDDNEEQAAANIPRPKIEEEINANDNKENINYAAKKGSKEKEGKSVGRKSKKAKEKLKENAKIEPEPVYQATSEKNLVKLTSSEVVKFPFIVLSTSKGDNDMSLNMDTSKKMLKIESKSPMQLYGDIDVLLKMGLHRISKESFEESIPVEVRKYISKEFTEGLP